MFSVSIMANAAYAVRPEVGSSREKDATWVGGQFDYDTKTFLRLIGRPCPLVLRTRQFSISSISSRFEAGDTNPYTYEILMTRRSVLEVGLYWKNHE